MAPRCGACDAVSFGFFPPFVPSRLPFVPSCLRGELL